MIKRLGGRSAQPFLVDGSRVPKPTHDRFIAWAGYGRQNDGVIESTAWVDENPGGPTRGRVKGINMNAVNLRSKLALIRQHWSPKIVGELNGQYVKLVKFAGEYVWHHHAEEDELFLVVQGRIEIHFRDRVVRLEEGEFCVVPRGVEHKPVAAAEASVLLFEPASTRNTGNVDHAHTIEAGDLERI